MALKAKDLRNENPEELRNRLRSLKKKLLEMKFQHAGGALSDPLQIRVARKDIARIQSVLKDKEKEEKNEK